VQQNFDMTDILHHTSVQMCIKECVKPKPRDAILLHALKWLTYDDKLVFNTFAEAVNVMNNFKKRSRFHMLAKVYDLIPQSYKEKFEEICKNDTKAQRIYMEFQLLTAQEDFFNVSE
jgi:hypothetical protein